MRQPDNFAPLDAAENAALHGKLLAGSLTHAELFPLVKHLAYECAHSLVLTAAADGLAGACAAFHAVLLEGALPTSPRIKYGPELLRPQVPHEALLARAFVIAELMQADHVVAFVGASGLDSPMCEALAAAKALGRPIALRGAPQAVRAAEAVLAGLPAGPDMAAPALFSAESHRRIAARLAAGGLEPADLAACALYLHKSPHVVVESPYAPAGAPADSAAGRQEVAVNLAYARLACRHHMLKGEMPSASHAEFTLPGVLNDGIEHERVLGIAAGLAKTLFYDRTACHELRGVSGGMKKGYEFAALIGRPLAVERIAKLPAFMRRPGEGPRLG